jgi:hypothetical protein
MSNQTTLPKDGGSKLKQKLAQREAELAIINSVQQALASHLEVQAIYDLVVLSLSSEIIAAKLNTETA